MSCKTLTLAVATTLAAAALFCFLPTAHADPCSGKRCNNTRISRLYLAEDGNVYVRPADGGQANLTCGSNNDNKTYLKLRRTHQSFREIYTTLLAVQLAGKTVSFRLPITSPSCTILYITVDR